MKTVIGLSGSLRKGSFNASLLRAAAELAPPELKIEIATIAGIPLYDGDVESGSGVPAIVAALKDRIAAADGLLLVTPEYNSGIPGVFKNAIDWLSRPDTDIERVFGGKPVALMGATPGRAGTRLSQNAWLAVLRTLGTQPWFGQQLYVAGARQAFDEAGALTDPTIHGLVIKFMTGFTKHIGA
jgi:chromate reductase, NAD(P)H dehydrogenase (quinone)